MTQKEIIGRALLEVGLQKVAEYKNLSNDTRVVSQHDTTYEQLLDEKRKLAAPELKEIKFEASILLLEGLKYLPKEYDKEGLTTYEVRFELGLLFYYNYLEGDKKSLGNSLEHMIVAREQQSDHTPHAKSMATVFKASKEYDRAISCLLEELERIKGQRIQYTEQIQPLILEIAKLARLLKDKQKGNEIIAKLKQDYPKEPLLNDI